MRMKKENTNTHFFHIMIQGINKEFIFHDENDKKKYIKIMKDTKETNNIMILSYCIMNNHAHILIYEKNIENLSKYMHKVNLIYAKYYNKRHNRVGYVFRDRYKMQPIYSEKHLQSCVRYIHNNPVKAKMCKKASEYKYSSCYNNIFYTGTELEKNIKKNLYVQEESISTIEEDFTFMEDEQNKEQICSKRLSEIMIKNNITRNEFYQDEKLINSTIKKLKIENNISYRIMEKVLGINRKRLRKIENKYHKDTI